jgi:2-aminoadipate transaminase
MVACLSTDNESGFYDRFFSRKALEARASDIRELFKALGVPGMVFFAGGAPAPESFPVEVVEEIVAEVLRDHGREALQYGVTLGYEPFRRFLLDWLVRRYRLRGDDLDIIITTSSQQALDLLGRVFINPRDTVIVEAPTYLAAVQAFTHYNPNFIQVGMDDEGLRVDELEDKLKALEKEGRRPKYLYTVPTYQNPAGVTMSESRRKKLVDLAHEHDFLIVEDNPYSELRYYGDPVRTVKSFDDENRVIYLGTVSKILAPGLRVGWVVGSHEVIRKFEIMKQTLDLCTSPLNQMIVWKYFEEGHLDKHLREIISLYKPRRDAMIEALRAEMPEGVKWTEPNGGMFIWLTLPSHIDTKAMLDKAMKEGVAYVPGESFFAHRNVKNCMRLNFTYEKEERIKEGIKRLAHVVGKELDVSE